jgi:hypothetical protein
MAKEGYKPTAGMKSAAKRAIRWKEQGKATGAGTAVGWTRAGQLARGETLSLSTVKRMYSFFSRHEVDKKGKDFYNTSNPSNGRIMWDAWGGDAGFSWSRKIVEREKNMKKSLTQSELFEEIKDILDDVVNPVDTVIEIPDDEEITKAYENCGCETCKAKNISCENCEDCISKSYESDDEEDDKWDNLAKACWSGYKQEGMKEKNGRMVPNCVPVNKAHHEEDMDKAKGKYEDVIGSRKGEPADKELYARVVAEAKRKFDTYPSAYANGWVVQEYKRRGGKYKVEKSIWGGAFIK